MGDAKTTAQSARCCACIALVVALLSASAVGAALFFSSTTVLELRELVGKMDTQSSALKTDHSHLAAQLNSMRQAQSELGSR